MRSPISKQALSFFRIALAGVPPHLGVFICERPAHGGWRNLEVVNDPSRAALLVAEIDARGGDAYYSLGLFRVGSTSREARFCEGVIGFWLDLDLRGSPARDGATKSDGAPDLDAAYATSHAIAIPTVFVFSGGGIQALHLFTTPWVFDSPQERHQAEESCSAWQEIHREAVAWKIDSTGDLARVFRPAATSNHKTDEPRPVRAKRSVQSGRHDVAALIALLLAQTDVKTSVRASSTAGIPVGDRNITLFRLACSLVHRGLSQKAVLDGLLVANQRCEALLGRREVQQIANSAERYRDSWLDAAPLSDQGNAERFAADHAGTVLHVAGIGWHVWDGVRWRPDSGVLAMQSAKKTARKLRQAAVEIEHKEIADKWFSHALRSENKSRLDAMLSLAQSEPAVLAEPAELDRDPLLLNTPSGVIDLRSGRISPNDPGQLLTVATGARYDPDASCPIFETS